MIEYSVSVRAILGVYGIRTAHLDTDADCWKAAMALFPGRVVAPTESQSLEDLHNQIHAMTRHERKRLGCENLRNVRGDWVSTALVHQTKLRKVAA